MLWRKKNQSHYIETNTVNSVSSRTNTAQVIPSVNTFHSSISTLSLASFIDVYCDGNLKTLIITGEPSAFELAAAWENILTEYADVVSTAESKSMAMLQKQISLIKAKLKLIDLAAQVLSARWSKPAADELIRLGYQITEEKYLKDLEVILVRSRSLIVQLKEKEKEYSAREGKTDPKSKTETKKKADFDSDIVALSKFQGYRIDKYATTVSEYANIYAQFLTHANGSRENR